MIAIACLATVASAEDLPRRKAEPPSRKVTGCEFLGQGYIKATGSDTCIRVSGSVRVEGGAKGWR